MVTITNGVKSFRVTAGAVEPYKAMGFYVASDEEMEVIGREVEEHHDVDVSYSQKPKKPHIETEGEDVDEDTAYVEELLEKPLSQWSNEEVKEFVRIKEIDTTGAQKVSQVRGIIKTYLEEQQRQA